MIDVSNYPTDNDGRKVLPDDIIAVYYRELPDNCINASGTKRTYHGGLLNVLGGDRSADKEIQSAGGKAVSAMRAQRRTLKQALDLILAKPVTQEQAEAIFEQTTGNLLPEDASIADLLGLAAVREAAKGNTRAFEVVRDSVGEKPRDELSVENNTLSPAELSLLHKVQARLEKQEQGLHE